MNKVFLSLLCALSLGLSGCMKSSQNIQYFTDVPAVIAYDRVFGQPVLITVTETFMAPELREYFQYAILREGEAILAFFNLDMNQEPVQGYRTITDFDCYQVGITTVVEEKEEVDKDDCLPIDEVQPFALIMHEKMLVMYVAFRQNTNFRSYTYTMTYDAGDTDGVPTLSVRSKGTGEPYATPAEFLTPYVFEMYDYIMSLPRDAQNQVKVNLRYRKGVDNSGNEIWAYCADNPLSIPLP